MGAVLGLFVGIGLLLVWQGVHGSRSVVAPRRPLAPIDDLLAAADMHQVSAAGLISLVGLAFGFVFGLAVVVTQTVPVALAFGVMAGYLPIAVVRARARTKRRERAEVWPEAVDHLASGVRAGLSLAEALTGLGDRGPEPLRTAFREFGRDYQASGRFGDCLDRLKDRLADPVGDRVVEALRVAREVGGGDLGRVLRALSGFLRDDARTRSELEARQSWVVNGARLACASPWVVLLVLAFHPEVIQRYRSPTGAFVLLAGGVTCVVAYRLMVTIGRLPQERRVLR